MTLNINQEIHVNASLEVTFDALLEQIGPHNEKPDGKPMPMKIEPWPGGRWYRDLGDNNGHLWGHVQAIKRPTLLEICGPLVRVLSLRLQRAIPADRGGRRNADHLPPHRARLHSGRPPGRRQQRLGIDLERVRKHAEAR